MKGKTLSWNDRLTLINHFSIDDTQATRVFGVTQGELDVARGQLKTGVFSLSEDLDVDSYAYLFAPTDATVTGSTTVTSTTAPIKKTGATSISKPAQTATAKAHVAKKRGRKGDKITKAFSSIPTSPIAADDFAKEHGVSIAVLRQSKRFDPFVGTSGTVRVKKDKGSKTLMIWRETV